MTGEMSGIESHPTRGSQHPGSRITVRLSQFPQGPQLSKNTEALPGALPSSPGRGQKRRGGIKSPTKKRGSLQGHLGFSQGLEGHSWGTGRLNPISERTVAPTCSRASWGHPPTPGTHPFVWGLTGPQKETQSSSSLEQTQSQELPKMWG